MLHILELFIEMIKQQEIHQRWWLIKTDEIPRPPFVESIPLGYCTNIARMGGSKLYIFSGVKDEEKKQSSWHIFIVLLVAFWALI